MDQAPEFDTTSFDHLIDYSRDVTRHLFGNHSFAHADSQLFIDSQTKRRREASRNIKIEDQYGDVLNKAKKPRHPLVRAEQQNRSLAVVSAFAPESSVIFKDTGKSLSQTKNESVSKDARALVVPLMNSVDRKAVALHDMVQPDWHAPWKAYRKIIGNRGWVHSLAVEPENMWFASGSRDGLIKLWDLASGILKLTLTGHTSAVRGLVVSERHPYLFSCGEDKKVICWDLTQNQIVRHYHGHLSGVYSIALDPNDDRLITGGRDSAARVWDMRTKEQLHCLTGHRDTVSSILCHDQLITGSHDTTIRLWDMKMARTIKTLTHHKKSVRALVMDHDKASFASGAIDNIKRWSYPDGEFIQNFEGQDSIINSLSINKRNVLVSGADNGRLFFWDWRTGYNFQRLASVAQRGSIESEAGILAMTFDKSGTRLITGETDKTIKMWREDPNATEETHPRPAPKRMITYRN